MYFEMIFGYGMRKDSIKLHSFTFCGYVALHSWRFCGYLFILVLCIEKTVLSLIELSWYPCWKSIVNVRVFFWILTFVPFIYLLILLLVPHYLNYFSIVVSFDIEKYESSEFVLSKDCFDLLGHLHFHINFRFNFIISAKKIRSYFHRDCLESENKFGSIVVLTLLRLSNNQHRCLYIY